MDTRRAESFSDGVFAVAITLLVIDLLPIGADALRGGELRHDLIGAWPQYAAYAISFLTIGIMWLNHHTMVAHLARVDRTMLVLNLFLLMGVVVIPFPTALVASSLSHGEAGAPEVAAVAYGLVMVVISVAFAGMWFYFTSHQQQLARGGRLDLPPYARLRFTGGLIGYVVGIAAAVLGSAAAALIIYAALAVYYLFENLPSPAAPAAIGDTPSG